MKQPSAHPVRSLSAKDRKLAERLRKMCLTFPEANERVSHGEPAWFAGKGKMFAMLDNHHHGSDHFSVWLPQPPTLQQLLIDSDPAMFFRPPYVGPSGWIGVVLDEGPDWDAVESLIVDAYLHVANKRQLAQLEAATSGARSGP